MLCCTAQNFAYYAQIMLTDIEQFPDIYSSIPIYCLQFCTFRGVSEAQTVILACGLAFYREKLFLL